MGTKRADALIREMLTSGAGLAEAVDTLADREVALREGYHSSYTSEHELMRDVLARSGFVPDTDGPDYAEDVVQGIEQYVRPGEGLGTRVRIDLNPDGEYRGEFSYHSSNGTQRGHGHKQLSDLLRGR